MKIEDAARIDGSPHRYTGYVRINNPSGGRGIASGSVVEEGVMVTAAHVVFDSDSLSWVTGVYMVPRHHQRYSSSDYVLRRFLFSNILREGSYRDRVERDRSGGVGEGLSSWDTFNLDIAVAARRADLDPRPMVPGNAYPVVAVDAERPESWLREPFEKIILGYPSQEGSIPEENQGFMHEVEAEDYLFWWDALTDDPSTHRDSGGFWSALYYSEDFRVYRGNSGGPVFVRDPDFGHWVNAAVVVGGSEGTSLVRAIDEFVWEMIDVAAGASGVRRLRRVNDLAASPDGSGTSVELRFTNRSSDSAGVAVLRQAGLQWEEIALVGPQANEFVDTDVVPGGRYVYAVQPVSTIGNRAPRSDVVRVSTPGANPGLGAAAGAPLLAWATDGEVPFVPFSGGARSGRVPSLGASLLSTTVTGPGDLTFRWSVSSERNTNIPDRGTTVPGGSQKLYDTFYFLVDGEVRRWMSGEVADDTVTMTLPAGTHDLVWEYRKDPYVDELKDAGFLHEVTWTETGVQRVYGAFDTGGGRMWAHWWGFFHEAEGGWIYHEELGWLYATEESGGDWWYSPQDGVGWFHTGGGVFPNLYMPATGWAHYRRGSGRGGAGAEVFDFGTARWWMLGAGL
ncbi:MAG: hypothetical protein JJU00_16350 [Opitutales bacterium]|nr:hypothetical protein [Opitutales bacterium]